MNKKDDDNEEVNEDEIDELLTTLNINPEQTKNNPQEDEVFDTNNEAELANLERMMKENEQKENVLDLIKILGELFDAESTINDLKLELKLKVEEK